MTRFARLLLGAQAKIADLAAEIKELDTAIAALNGEIF